MTDPVIIETGSEPTGSIIWLHGLGADGHDFEPIVPELRLPDSLSLRFIFPHAPVQPVTINGGMAMRAWFDILDFAVDAVPDVEGIEASCAMLDSLVAAETERGVPRDRILIAGFSQGGVIAIHTALRSPEPLAGLLALSTWLPLADRLAGYPKHADLPVFMAHGQFDPVLPLPMGVAARDAVRKAGLEPAWLDYPMAHGVCPQEIADISRWLQSVYDDE